MSQIAPLHNVDLRVRLEFWAKRIIARMRQGITQQKGVDNQPMQALSPRTLADRRRRGIESTRRLEDTGALRRNGFVSEVDPLKLEIGLSDEPHPRAKKGESYDQIGAWNQRSVTDKPYNPEWFGVPAKMYQDALLDVAKEITRQLTEQKPGGIWDTKEVKVSV